MRKQFNRPDLHNAVARAEQAGTVMDNPVFGEAVDAVRKRLFNRWIESKDPREREEVHAQAVALGDINRQLQAFLASGAFAEEDLRRSKQ